MINSSHYPHSSTRLTPFLTKVTVTTAGIDMHSGLKGGSVQNANHALIQLLATLKDSRRRVAVAGFYKDVQPMTWDDRNDVKTYARAFDAAAEQVRRAPG